MGYVRLPVGIEHFEEIRNSGSYYIDKTGFIRELLQDFFKVSLITRPRRFGKTLMMSMLADFFDIRKNSRFLFDGLEISHDARFCGEWMNQYPVLFLTLKNIEGLNFETAYDQFQDMIVDVFKKYADLKDSPLADQDDRALFARIKAGKGTNQEIEGGLYLLMRMMEKHYGKQVILLIDEYDVPLARANENGYYAQMLDLIRRILGKLLKSNEFLKFAVITGCLRIAKESIFTGTNNFVSDSVSSEKYGRYFGFTEAEVKKLLKDTGFSGHGEEMKIWYDGYRFGKTEVYCPWDVLNHVMMLQTTPDIKPANYWKNTSHNGIIRSFIDRTDLEIHDKFEVLLSGGYIQERICEDLTYDVLHSSEENLWSVLYLTGYLTKADPDTIKKDPMETDKTYLKIPNEEIKTIFADTVAVWFGDRMKALDRKELFEAFWSGKEEKITEMVTDILFDTISYYDYKEDYYHAFLSGIFVGAGYGVESNHEYGKGRPDIVVKDRRNRRAMVIEVKHSKTEKKMEQDCEAALVQMEAAQYARQFLKGYRTVLCYGAAFFEKECRIKRREI